MLKIKEELNPFTDETEKEYDRKTLHDFFRRRAFIPKTARQFTDYLLTEGKHQERSLIQ
ncbi:hypothetical protein [Labilibaculum euxinus]